MEDLLMELAFKKHCQKALELLDRKLPPEVTSSFAQVMALGMPKWKAAISNGLVTDPHFSFLGLQPKDEEEELITITIKCEQLHLSKQLRVRGSDKIGQKVLTGLRKYSGKCCITFNGTVLDEHKTFGDYQIEDWSVLQVKLGSSIFVKTRIEGSRIYVNMDSLVDELKSKIEVQEGIPLDDQSLVLLGRDNAPAKSHMDTNIAGVLRLVLVILSAILFVLLLVRSWAKQLFPASD